MSNPGDRQGMTLLSRIREFFTESNDFNGISGEQLARDVNARWPDMLDELSRLVELRQVDVVFASHSGNPHIKRVGVLPPGQQLERLGSEGPGGLCLYPTGEVLRAVVDVRAYEARPYTARLALAEPQLTPVFFELAVLDQYFRDPRYAFVFADYDGSISVQTDHYLSPRMPAPDKVLLESFGIGYDNERARVVAVFLRYLSGLSPEHQQLWRPREIAGQCTMNGDYERAAIWGIWPEHHSVYRAFIQEQSEINKLARLIGKQRLFKQTFDEDRRPREFIPMLRPTRRNLGQFVHTLDKMLSDNMDREFFRGDVPLEDRVARPDGSVERTQLNSLTLLERWLSSRYRTADGDDASGEVLAPFREVRKRRQPEAHALSQDEYDPALPREQDDLLGRVTLGLTKLRLILSSHPAAKAYTPPQWLEGGKLVFY